MRIINRYVLKEHIGPFLFALSALTSLLLLQYIARRFGDLVGRGLTWQVITEFMLLSIPFTLALTVPMSVLVAVLYAFSRLASENEITALKAGGVSTRSLMRPVIVAGSLLGLFMLYFNDQLMPRANHELATLQVAILRTKPTFALRPQVLNTIKEGNLYMRAGTIDESSGLMRDVTIYDLGDPGRRRTIYADSGTLTFAGNRRDLNMLLTNGVMISAPSEQPMQLSRVYYRHETLKVKDVANTFNPIDADTASKGDREMSICEMQKSYNMAATGVRRARYDSLLAVWRLKDTGRTHPAQPEVPKPAKIGGIGAVYCTIITKYFRVPQAQAAELPARLRRPPVMARQPQQPVTQDTTKKRTQDTTKRSQDTTKRVQDTTKRSQDTTKRVQDTTKRSQDTTKRAQDTTKPALKIPAQAANSVVVIVNGQYRTVPDAKIPDDAYYPSGLPAGKRAIAAEAAGKPLVPAFGNRINGDHPTTTAAPNVSPGAPVNAPAANAIPGASPANAAPRPGTAVVTPPATSIASANTPQELIEAGMRIGEARQREARFAIEIQKKFSLAAACIVFVLVGAPLAVRFPRGGVGLVIGASFFVFAVYYIALTSGESLANRNFITPFWAMWADNIIFLAVAAVLIARMGTERVTSRGGGMSEKIDGARLWFARQGQRIGLGRSRGGRV